MICFDTLNFFASSDCIRSTMNYFIHLFLIFFHLTTRATSKDASKSLHISLISIPIAHHFEPLLALATSLQIKGHRVTIAIPSTHEKWARTYKIPSGIQLVPTNSPESCSASNSLKLLKDAIVAQKDRVYQEENIHTSIYTDLAMLEFFKVSNLLSRKGLYDTVGSLLAYYHTFHEPMLETLIEFYSNDPPDLFVVDRYTFAGFSIAHKLNISYIVNSPGPLSDIDNPANHVPAPLSGNSIHLQSVLGRCLNLVFRLRYRLTTHNIYYRINQVRSQFSIAPITSRNEIYGNTVVLANTMFGIDDARPMSPLILIVGALNVPTTTHLNYKQQQKQQCLNNRNKNNKKYHSKKKKYSIVVQLSSRVPIPKVTVLTLLTTLAKYKNLNIVCVLPRKDDMMSQLIQNEYSYDEDRTNKDYQLVRRATIYNKFCNKVIPDFISSDSLDTPKLVLEADAIILSGDAANAYRAVARGQPIILLPFFADQLDLSVRLQRVGCGLIINPMNDDVEMFKKEILKTIDVIFLNTNNVREKMLKSMKWMRGVLLSTGGTKAASNYIETIARFGTGSITPHKDTLVWYSKYAIDVYVVFIVILFIMWLTTKTCSSAMNILWSNLNNAELSNLNGKKTLSQLAMQQ